MWDYWRWGKLWVKMTVQKEKQLFPDRLEVLGQLSWLVIIGLKLRFQHKPSFYWFFLQWLAGLLPLSSDHWSEIWDLSEFFFCVTSFLSSMF
jgi:hypothetical protein